MKPSLFKNEVLGVADPLLTILFESLWCLADKAGRLEDRPMRIKAETFPYRDNVDINGYLTELERLGFIRRYEAGGMRLIEVLNFIKHQKPHHTERDSELPPYKGVTENTVKTPLSNGYAPSDSLNTDSLNTEQDCVCPADAPASEPTRIEYEPVSPDLRAYVDEVTEGICGRLQVVQLRDQADWLATIEYAKANRFTADQVLEVFDLLRAQKWRRGRITAKNVGDNLTELTRLRTEIEQQNNGTGNSSAERNRQRIFDNQQLIDDLRAGRLDETLDRLHRRDGYVDHKGLLAS